MYLPPPPCVCTVASQLIFYLAPGIMVPSLYLEIQASEQLTGASAASSYSFVLMTCTVVAMAAPVPLGVWAERRGEREVYAGVTLLATFAALLLAFAWRSRSSTLGICSRIFRAT